MFGLTLDEVSESNFSPYVSLRFMENVWKRIMRGSCRRVMTGL